MRFVSHFFFDETLWLASTCRVVPVEKLLEGGVDVLMIEHNQTLQPGEYKLVFGEDTVR
jgi:hypothetical protein